MTTARGPEAAFAEPGDPRRVALSDLVGRVAAVLAGLARHYHAASEGAAGPLREALLALAREQEELASEVAPVARALDAPPPAPTVPTSAPPRWGLVLGEAFAWERMVELLGRELAVLARDRPLGGLGARLAAAAARDGQEIRRLYLRYS